MKTLDRDGGGSIGEEELGKVMKTFGWDPKEEELKVCGRKKILSSVCLFRETPRKKQFH